ncbi:glycosyltransferase family 2 protein [Aeromicrobium phragmitis]|uniref:Glycosyltransferase family 2 protein n=1 Tax=Aeromicrobium phragmitis TaxID=2478914 RepID=A0A3L8PHW3_9ACTN|nr:glycosyltransferase family 2 protein [Aeromicrobium phragmitis]RLV54640.1 glycosyltransferase family 2 protein [Aeromicrobium phragmitis]
MDEEEQLPAWRSAPPSVLAVIVSRRGERWLPQTLASLARLDHLPTGWIAVDVESDDATRELLSDALGAEHVISSGSPDAGFGESIRRAVEAAPRTDWIWLLHDDAIVDPGALTALLDEATSADDIAVVGPKVREWPSLRRLLEVGRTITGTGALETGLEPGEPDAGQHDWPRDVLAVSTAGMLVRRDVWDELDGLDPALPLFFDDIDFGWRVARAGYRTRTAPAAVIFHAEASSRRTRRRRPVAGEHRRAAVYTILANARGPRFWWQSVRLFVGTILRMLGFLVVKDTRAASAELAALREVFAKPGLMRRARARRAATARAASRDIAPLFPSVWLPYQHGWDVVVESVRAAVRPEAVQTLGRRSSTIDLIDEEIVVEDGDPWWRRYPWATTVLVLTLLALIAGRGLWTGSVASPVLPPSPESVADWWRDLFARTADATGLGSAAWPAPYLPVLAVVGLLVAFAPGLLTWALIVFAVPLAAVTAHRFGRTITERRGPRIVWAVGYGLLTAASGAAAQGRFGTVVALILAPVLANVVAQLIVLPTWTRAAQVGLWLAVVSVFAPAAFLIAALAIAGLLVVARLRPSWELLIGVGAAIVVAGPSWWRRIIDPADWWWEAGIPRGVETSALDIVTGSGGGPGGAPWWLAVGLLILGVLALIPRATRFEVSLAWWIALSGLLVAAIGTAVPAVAGPDGSSSWSGLGAAVWLAGLGTAVLLAAGEVGRWGRRAVIAGVVVAVIFPVGVSAWWVLRGTAEPVSGSVEPTIPAYLADQGHTTLVIDGSLADGVTIDVVEGAGPHLGQEAVEPSPQRRERFASTVTSLLATSSGSDVEELARYGVDAIYLPDADTSIAQGISAAPGLLPAGSDRPGSRVWTLDAVEASAGEPPEAGAWRPYAVGGWLVAWAALAIAAVPGRRSPDEEEAS